MFPIFNNLKTLKNESVLLLIDPFSLGNLPLDQKWKTFIHIWVHTITLNTMTKYKVYPYIQTSLNQIFGNFQKLKNLEKWLGLNVHQPFFRQGNFPQDPEFKTFSNIRVHTITLNTVTKYKVYPYIQTSLNQIFGIFNNLKTLENH